MRKIFIRDLKYLDGDDGVTPWLKTQRSIYVKFIVDNIFEGESVVSPPSARSNIGELNIYFEASPFSILKIMVYDKALIRNDIFKGGVEYVVGSLSSGVITSKLFQSDAGSILHEKPQSIEFVVEVLGVEPPLTAIEDPDISYSSVTPGTPVGGSDIGEAITAAKGAIQVLDHTSWHSFLRKVQKFTNVVKGIVEVHPFAKAAWGVLSSINDMLVEQMDRDEQIKDLVYVLDRVYGILQDADALKFTRDSVGAESLPLSRRQSRVLASLAKQTFQCVHFVLEYIKDTGYWKRTRKHTLSRADAEIQGYKDSFLNLQKAFLEDAVLLTEITVIQIKFATLEVQGRLDTIAADNDLKKMFYSQSARYNIDKECLPTTRQAIIDEITIWATKPVGIDDTRIYWLNGVAGSGKSAIAHSVAKSLDALQCLGSSFCFSVTGQSTKSPQHLFSTIAHDLANFNPEWKHALWNVIKDNQSRASTQSVHEQFQMFIMKPAERVRIFGPVVFVIDALDESGDVAARKDILKIFSDRTSLPANFRIVVTSRAESDIEKALQNKSHVISKRMETIDSMNDISLFIQTELSDEATSMLNKRWVGGEWLELLVQSSQGLFQWAYTACLYLNEPLCDPIEQLQLILSSQESRNLDLLYTQILQQKISASNRTHVKHILGTVLTVRQPLPLSDLGELCLDYNSDMVKKVLQGLGSLLSGVGQDSTPVQTLHTSFYDFLTNEDRSGDFFIEIKEQHQRLTLGALSVMRNCLYFNICKLPSSYKKNEEIDDLESRIETHIPHYLSYACKYWAEHLAKTDKGDRVLSETIHFIEQSVLYWLEVLSLIKEVNLAIHSLEIISQWLKDYKEDISALAADSAKFVGEMWTPITISVPHIYVSALPFAPQKSIMAKHYIKKFKNLLVIKHGQAKNWPGVKNILEHTSVIKSVTCSSDGKHIVSGLADGTIKVWDIEAGYNIYGPSKGHTAAVNSVAYSPKGEYIVSGSVDRTLRIWDALNGYNVSEPFEGHTKAILSVAYSPDGKHVVSGSADGTIRIWNAETGENVPGSINGHTGSICSVAYSSNGKNIVSGSVDGTLRIWDAMTGHKISEPFVGHTGTVWSVAFSPVNQHIVSGSADRSIRIWDAETGNIVSGPFEGHSSDIKTIAYSPNGRYIVSGSVDRTLKIWDAETGNNVAGPFSGHTKTILSATYSSDGRHIISGSADRTIRIWDTIADHSMSETYEGHTSPVYSVAYSSDGKQIVSGSSDRTLRVWDAKTGLSISKPFEGHTDYVRSVVCSPDGRYIASGSADKTVRVWDIVTGHSKSGPFKGHTDYIRSIAYSPDGKHIVSGSVDKTIRVWDTDTGHLAAGPFEGHTGAVYCVTYSPNGRYVASGSADMTVRIWESKNGQSVSGPFEGHTAALRSVAYSPNERHIASGSLDMTIRVWDAETGDIVAGPFKGHTSAIRSIAYSPDGMYIASGSFDKTIGVWAVGSGHTKFRTLEGHTARIYSVAYSPDGKYIVSGSADGAIRVWDVKASHPMPESDPKHIGVTRSIHENYTTSDNDQANAPTSLFQHNSISRDGWVCTPNSELLFWVPVQHRDGLYWPSNTVVIGQHRCIIDGNTAVHGEEWDMCKI